MTHLVSSLGVIHGAFLLLVSQYSMLRRYDDANVYSISLQGLHELAEESPVFTRRYFHATTFSKDGFDEQHATFEIESRDEQQ